MNLTVGEGVSAITVLIQGLISFFSPCVLPLLPVYIGYLSGGTVSEDESGVKHYDSKRVMLNTLFFVIGVAFAFFLLGLGLRAIGRFFRDRENVFTIAGGILVILFGLYQLGIFGRRDGIEKERRLPVDFDKMAMSPVTALLLGFVFSFAWTPCVGPTLSGVLLMATSAESSKGFLLIGIYTIGFVIPFLLTGLFTTTLLDAFKKHGSVVRYTVKIGGVLLIFMGILMITGHMNSISAYFSRLSGQESVAVDEVVDEAIDENVDEAVAAGEEAVEDAKKELIQATDFTLKDQYGVTHTLSDYKGKIVFLNFWATWCPPCRAEMPHIQELYEELQENGDPDTVILAVAFPGISDETDEAGITAFMEDNGYTYPTLMDSEGELIYPYYISAFPTTYMIDRDGNIYGYLTGSMTKETMKDIISQTREGSR